MNWRRRTWVQRARRLRWKMSRRQRLIVGVGAAVLVFALVVLDLAVGISPWSRGKGVLVPPPPTATARPIPTPRPPTKDEATGLIYGYNLTMQDFSLTLNTWVVYRYLHPDGPLWAEIKAMAEQRAASGEIHYVTLNRFGVGEVLPVAQDAQGPYILVRVAEEWTDTLVDRTSGRVVYENVTVAQEVVYILRPVEGDDWLLWSQEVVHVVGAPELATTPLPARTPQGDWP